MNCHASVPTECNMSNRTFSIVDGPCWGGPGRVRLHRKLAEIQIKDLRSLQPGRQTDRWIAMNVLRFYWCPRSPFARKLWIKGSQHIGFVDLRPSTDDASTNYAVRMFVDEYVWPGNVHVVLELSIESKRHWRGRWGPKHVGSLRFDP